ncbi:MAG TPA: UDP-glucose/GDP-mannose dehydrogenase family protein [Burkholderiales bacterium]|nr:UDP-glucose/GDP-mannose dehydrogenase family protein [Burkholderiales bacterium]
MNVTVIGTGYVGLVTGACLADAGNHVLCLDVDEAKIDALNKGQVPIFEPGLEPIVKRNREAGRLAFTTDVPASVSHADLQLIAVGTPPDEDGSADMQYVLAAATQIGRHMKSWKVIATKSTVPVGTADRIRDAVQKETSLDFAVVSNPEFLKEGAAIDDFMRPDRIIVGADDARAIALLKQLYAPFQRNSDRMIVMGVRSAELTKYAANAMLATRISFMNELANLSEALGADIEEVRKGVGSDPRIGNQFLYPGAGYGGSCFPKDVKALQRTAAEARRELRVVAAVEAVNDAQKHVLATKIKRKFGERLNGRCFAIWGLAFKANTDDMREASSRTLIADLVGAGARVRAYDPVAGHEARRIFGDSPGVEIVPSAFAALEGADALAIVTEWQEFRSPDFATIKAKLKSPCIFDGRNLYDPAVVKELGIEYHPIGRKT